MQKIRKRLLFFVLIASALMTLNCRQVVDALGIRLSLDQRNLSNGMTVIMVEDHTVPVVSYQTWFRVGSVDEYPGITGISHLFEHLMFKGTPKYGPKEFFLQLEAKGAEVNAFTTRDYTVYYESVPSDLLPRVIDMESDRMENLSLNDEILNVERLVVLEERRLRTENSPDGKIQEALWQLAYRQHPYHWPVIGFPADVLKITTDQLTEYFKSHYQPANAALIVVGDFKSDSTFELIKKHYEKIPAQKRPERKIPEEPEQNEERRFTIREQVASERFTQGYHITAAADDDSYSLDVLANILFEGTSSRAYRSLVEEQGLLISIAGSAFTPAYPGLFMIMGVMRGKLPSSQGEAALDKVIQNVQENGVTEGEVKKAVKQLTVQLVDSVRTFHGLGQLIGTVQMIFDSPKRFTEDLSKYTQVKASDVQRVAVKYLHPNNRSVVTLTSPKKGEKK
jgi:zinc protease